MPDPAPKLFCIGFQKTGTTSLYHALTALGYSVAGYYQFRDFATCDRVSTTDLEARALAVARDFDAARDTPWPLLYGFLDRAFPGSQFIHVERPTDAWIASAVGDFGSHPNPIHQWIYGSAYPKGNEEAWIARYEQHNAEVKQYFQGRETDFISLDMAKNEVNWENICRFLGKDVLNKPWPVSNTKRQKKRNMLYWKIRDRILGR